MSEVIPIWSHQSFQSASVPLPESWVQVREALGLQSAGFPRAFSFRRRRRDGRSCTEIWLRFSGGFNLNWSVHTETWPRNFATARVVAREVAKIHGFTFREIPANVR